LIDGTTQPGYNGVPLITIDGTNINDGPGIRLGTSRIVNIRGLIVQNLADDPGISGGGVEVLLLSNSIIRGNAGPGVSVSRPLGPPVETPTITITNSQFLDNSGDGVVAGVGGYPYSTANITGSLFNGNNRGIFAYFSGGLTFVENEAAGNFFDGALLLSGSSDPLINATVNSNVFEGNGGTGVTIGTTGYLGFSDNDVLGNGSVGADLGGGAIAPEINEFIEVRNNTIEDNDGTGFRSNATGAVTVEGNTVRRNGGDGGSIQYEQYVGSGTGPPSVAMSASYNNFEGNFGTGLAATDSFWNFSLTATNNTFSGNASGLVTSAYSLGASGNTFTLHPAEGLQPTDPNTTGSILSNTFTDNGTGISLPGGGVAVNFNRIAGNSVGLANSNPNETSNAVNNWWGCNDLIFAGTCDIANGSVDFIPWLVLTPSAAPTTIPFGATSSILADFRLNSDGQDTSGAGNMPNDAMVEFSTDLGSFDNQSVLEAPTSGGVAGVTLEADEGPGTAHIRIQLDAANLEIEVVISSGPPSATPTVSPSPSAAPTATSAPTLRKQGDLDCNNLINARDGLFAAAHAAGSPFSQTGTCPVIGSGNPQFGDVTCANGVGMPDVVAILQYSAGVTIKPPQPGGCTPFGQNLPS
jgi:hypothetical protein